MKRTPRALDRGRREEILWSVPTHDFNWQTVYLPRERLVPGCLFAPRCALATQRCRQEYPPLERKAPGHWAACWHSERIAGGHVWADK